MEVRSGEGNGSNRLEASSTIGRRWRE